MRLLLSLLLMPNADPGTGGNGLKNRCIVAGSIDARYDAASVAGQFLFSN